MNSTFKEVFSAIFGGGLAILALIAIVALIAVLGLAIAGEL